MNDTYLPIRVIRVIRGQEIQFCQDFLDICVVKYKKTASETPERQEEAEFCRFHITFISSNLPNRAIEKSGQKGQEMSVFQQNSVLFYGGNNVPR